VAKTPSRHGCRVVFAALAMTILVPSAHAALPTYFVDELVANVPQPTALAFMPDGRMLITSQSGSLYVYQNGALLPFPVLTFPPSEICTNIERGLLGVAVDPLYSQTFWIYLYYTYRNGVPDCAAIGPGPRNRVLRLVLLPDNTVVPGTETLLLEAQASTNGRRNGGDLQFGRDNFLYIGVGDGAVPDQARAENTVAGKVLRLTRLGGIPPTNPFQGGMSGRCHQTGTTTATRCQETFSWGFRNPWRLAFDPNADGSVFRINDVGELLREEINVGQSAADFGWNCREGTLVGSTTGPCATPPPNAVPPIFEWAHNAPVPGTASPANCHSITGGAFVPNGLWPGFDGGYLFGDYICGWIFSLSAGGGGAPFTAADFATSVGPVVTMAFGPYGNAQALYYTTYNGQVRRIRYFVPGNQVPTAVGSASPLGGAVPLTVTFDGTGSSDPDSVPGTPLRYFWDFGDGGPVVSTLTTTIQHTYTTAGFYTARLRVRDEDYAFSAPVNISVWPGNSPPVPTITTPAPTDTFRVGQVVNLTGSATDAEDGVLPANRLVWTVIRHHETPGNPHTHPYLGPTPGSPVPMTGPPPEDVLSGDNSFLEVRLTAFDLAGLPTTVTRNFQPFKVPISFGTSPPGLTIPVNGTNLQTPISVVSWAGYVLNVDAPDQIFGGSPHTWLAWSDGGPRAHAITTGTTAALYGATFQAGPPLVLKYRTVTPCRLIDTRGAPGPTTGPALTSGVVRNFPVLGNCFVQFTAKAVAMNITVTGATSFGNLAMWAEGGLRPNSSVINFKAGTARANNAIVSIGAPGGISVVPTLADGGTVHLVVDIVGYFQ
jgi:glucose/arabinose dehydrogenase